MTTYTAVIELLHFIPSKLAYRVLRFGGAINHIHGTCSVTTSTSRAAQTCRAQQPDAEIQSGLECARRGVQALALLDIEARISILKRATAHMQSRKIDLVAEMVRETAMPIKHARDLFDMSLKKLEFGYGYTKFMHGESFPETAPDRVAFTLSEPYGVVLGVFPFISPLYLAAEIFSATLMTGNALIFHAPPQVENSFRHMVAIFHEAGVPPEAIVLLSGLDNDIALQLAGREEVDMILSMAGSYGKRLSTIAGECMKPVWLSITGKNPTIVFADADLELAARYVAWGATFISGLVCTDIEIVLVHHSVAERFKEALLKELESLRTGDPWEEETDIGPIIFPKLVENADRQIEDAVSQGARLISGGGSKDGFFAPTVIDLVHSEMAIVNERTSAPVVPIIEFDTDEEALDVANANPYGLRAAIFTKSIDTAFKAARRLQVSGVMVNHAPFHHHTLYPDGGYKESGFGTLRYLIEELRRKKLVVFHHLPMSNAAAS